MAVVGARGSSQRVCNMVLMAIDKRATRLGVLALVGTLLFGLIGARLWFLQTVEQEALQARSTPPNCARSRCCPNGDGSSMPTGASWPTTNACSPWRSIGRCCAVTRTAARSSGGSPVGSTCPSRTWKTASRVRCTARSSRCPWPRTSTSEPRPRSRSGSRTCLVCRSWRSRGVCTRSRRSPATWSATWGASPPTRRTRTRRPATT